MIQIGYLIMGFELAVGAIILILLVGWLVDMWDKRKTKK